MLSRVKNVVSDWRRLYTSVADLGVIYECASLIECC